MHINPWIRTSHASLRTGIEITHKMASILGSEIKAGLREYMIPMSNHEGLLVYDCSWARHGCRGQTRLLLHVICTHTRLA